MHALKATAASITLLCASCVDVDVSRRRALQLHAFSAPVAVPPLIPVAPAHAAAKKYSAADAQKAFAELKKAVTEYPGATIIKASVEDRYLYAEVEDGLTGIKDDVEFLFSLNNPIVGYRSAPRVGGDAKRQKVRIRDLRKTLQESGWKSVGRAVNVE